LQWVIVESLPRQFAVTLFQHIWITPRTGGGLSPQLKLPLYCKHFIYAFQQFLGTKGFGHIVVNLGNV